MNLHLVGLVLVAVGSLGILVGAVLLIRSAHGRRRDRDAGLDVLPTVIDSATVCKRPAPKHASRYATPEMSGDELFTARTPPQGIRPSTGHPQTGDNRRRGV